MGYQRNKYYWCVINKIVRGKQCTILSYFDDLKVLHIYSGILSSVLSDIDAKITITQGYIRKYLGMTID